MATPALAFPLLSILLYPSAPPAYSPQTQEGARAEEEEGGWYRNRSFIKDSFEFDAIRAQSIRPANHKINPFAGIKV
jgi:hypothetical protein